MVMKNRTVRFIIPAAIALVVLLATGCENPANSSSDSVSGDTTDADPHTLVLSAGTVSGASGEYFLVYRGAGGEDNLTNQNFKKFSAGGGAIPSIQLGLADVESLLVPSNTVADNDNALFNTANPPTITPTVNMMRLQRIIPVKNPTGWNDTERIVRANRSPIQDGSAVIPDGTYVVEWWYADEAATVSGEFYFESIDRDVDPATNFQLQRGWNRIIYFITDDENTRPTVSTGQEPAGLDWHFISIGP